MDLTQLANLGEFIGGVAVLLTLVYLAVQVRQGNSIVRSQVEHETSRRSSELLLTLAEPEHRDLGFRAIAAYNEYPPPIGLACHSGGSHFSTTTRRFTTLMKGEKSTTISGKVVSSV